MPDSHLKKFDLDGKSIVYFDKGEGIPIIFAHCSNTSHKEWRFLFDAFKNYRTIAPDFIGYGYSQRLNMIDGYSFFNDVDVLQKLINKCSQPIHLVGHSFGGAVCLEACRLNPDKIVSMVLIEPAAFHLLKQSGYQKEWGTIKKIGETIIEHAKNSKPKKAANVFMNFWLGRLKWMFMKKKSKMYVCETINKVALELDGIEHVDIPNEKYEEIATPTLLIAGAKTPRPATVIINILARLIPGAQTRTIRGAGHMSPYTHPKKVKELICKHITNNA